MHILGRSPVTGSSHSMACTSCFACRYSRAANVKLASCARTETEPTSAKALGCRPKGAPLLWLAKPKIHCHRQWQNEGQPLLYAYVYRGGTSVDGKSKNLKVSIMIHLTAQRNTDNSYKASGHPGKRATKHITTFHPWIARRGLAVDFHVVSTQR